MRSRTILLACTAFATPLDAQTAPPPDDEANPPAALYHQIGVVTPRSSIDLYDTQVASPFSIGAEQTDRGFSTFSKWSSYLPWLGIPAARVQVGWDNVEPTINAPRNFDRLNEIYDGMAAVRVKPWFDLVYGNHNYGGTPNSSSPLPAVGTPRMAWLAFVRATVQQFNSSGRSVQEWEIWNEPNHTGIDALDYASFAVDTAKVIKEVRPDAKILIGSFAGIPGSSFYKPMLDKFDQDRGPTIPASDVQVTFHPYTPNPDDTYNAYGSFRANVEGRGYTLRQGENGAPSEKQSDAALKGMPFTETRQAKWDLRRLLGDFYRGVPSSLFTITDTHMDDFVNKKGLLRTVGGKSSTPPTYGDQTVDRPKVAYGAVRALTAIFDGRLTPIPQATANCSASSTGYAVHAYTRLDAGNIRRNALVVWRTTRPAGDTTGSEASINAAPADITVTCTGFQFPRFKSNASLRPRFTDLLAAKVYELLGTGTVVHSAAGVTVTGLRVYDSPVIMADQGIVPVTTS